MKKTNSALKFEEEEDVHLRCVGKTRPLTDKEEAERQNSPHIHPAERVPLHDALVVTFEKVKHAAAHIAVPPGQDKGVEGKRVGLLLEVRFTGQRPDRPQHHTANLFPSSLV